MFRTFHAFVTSTLCPNSKCKESIKILLSYPQELSLRTLPLFHSTHFYSDARAVEQMRGCVVIFILAAVFQFFFIHAKCLKTLYHLYELKACSQITILVEKQASFFERPEEIQKGFCVKYQ